MSKEGAPNLTMIEAKSVMKPGQRLVKVSSAS